MSADDHAIKHYVKVWAILLALLVVSILGPTLEIQAVTLVTAFGIAVTKALMVVRNFMHLPLERRFITYIVSTCLVFMLLFYAAVAPDVMKSTGTNWEKPAWIAEQSAYEAGKSGEASHGEEGDHGEPEGAH